MLVFHGSNTPIKSPKVSFSERNLDFGKGFYVTSNKEQAIRWAKRKTFFSKSGNPYVSVFKMEIDVNLNIQDFTNNIEDWLDFVCECRDGSEIYKKYDVIIGKVADDKVFRVVDMYKSGIWDKDRAIKERKIYDNYDQICFISQKAIDQSLTFEKGFDA